MTAWVWAYVQWAFSLAIATFFLAFTYRYFKSRSVSTSRILSTQRGGLFEFYKVVVGLVLFTIILHLWGFDPFDTTQVLGQLRSWFVDFIAQAILWTMLFFVLTWLGLTAYMKLKQINDRSTIDYYIHRMILASFILAYGIAFITSLIIHT
jgi:hypothetical protein